MNITKPQPTFFNSKPLMVMAFQWNPEVLGSMEKSPSSYPKWAFDLREHGKLREVITISEPFLCLGNKRGDYRALPGDWIVKDSFGHVFVVSGGTFNDRFLIKSGEQEDNQ